MGRVAAGTRTWKDLSLPMRKPLEPTGHDLAAFANPGEDDCDIELPGGGMPPARNPACSAMTCSDQASHTLSDLVLNVTATTIVAGAVVTIGLLAIARLQ